MKFSVPRFEISRFFASITRQLPAVFALLCVACTIVFSGCGGNSAGVAGGGSGTTGTTSSTASTTGGTTGLGSITDFGQGITPQLIDDTGRMVIFESTTRTQSFFKDGVRTPIPSAPDGVKFTIMDMNFAGQICGYTEDSSGNILNSYLLQGSSYTKLTPPLGSKFIQPAQIAENGKVLGVGDISCIWDPTGTPTNLTIPKGFIPTTLNSSGDIVGYTDRYTAPSGMTTDTWYKLSGGTFSSLNVLIGHSYLSSVYNSRISDDGTIVVSEGTGSQLILPSGQRKPISIAIQSRITSNGSFCGSDTVTQIVNQSLWKDAGRVYYAPLGFVRSIKSIVDPTGPKLLSGSYVMNNSLFSAGGFIPAVGDGWRMYTIQLSEENIGGIAPEIVMSSTASILARGSLKFNPVVKYSADISLSWSITESTGGSISSDGTYSAPSRAGTFHVVATLVANPSIKATTAVTVSGLGGDSGPTYSEPQPVQGPSAGFVVSRVKPEGAMAGYSTDSNPEALYWSSPSSAPTTLNRTGYIAAKATDTRNGVIVGLVTDSSYSYPAYWATSSSAPVKLSIPSGVSFYPSDTVSINSKGEIVYGNLFWSGKDVTGVSYADPTVITSSGVRPTILDDSSIIIADAMPTKYFASPTSAVQSLSGGSNFFNTLYGAADDGSEVYGVSGGFLPGAPSKWTKTSGLALTELSLPSQVDRFVGNTKSAEGIWGSTRYSDTSTGVGIVGSSGTYSDLRAMITNADSWLVGSFVGRTNAGASVILGRTASASSNSYLYVTKL